MSTIVKNPIINKTIKILLLIVGGIVGLYVGSILIQAVFNLGVGFGTFLRCLYHVLG